MSLTIGRAPLAPKSDGVRRNFPLPEQVVVVERLGRRVRAVLGGRTVVDSDEVQLVHETGSLPRYAFPAEHVHVEATPAAALDGHVEVAWDAVDGWFEEDERVLVHPRDPYHRVDTFRTSRRVEVHLGEVHLASSTRATALHETSLPVRYYLPVADLRLELLTRSTTVTECPYKGTARYWSAVLDDRVVEDIAWSYDDDLRREGEPVRRLVSFDDQKVTVEVSP